MARWTTSSYSACFKRSIRYTTIAILNQLWRTRRFGQWHLSLSSTVWNILNLSSIKFGLKIGVGMHSRHSRKHFCLCTLTLLCEIQIFSAQHNGSRDSRVIYKSQDVHEDEIICSTTGAKTRRSCTKLFLNFSSRRIRSRTSSPLILSYSYCHVGERSFRACSGRRRRIHHRVTDRSIEDTTGSGR